MDLSILIPARNEMFLNRTVEDILSHAKSDFEIIIVLDGQWPTVPLPIDGCVQIIFHNESVGQRAACNEAARIASGKYLMKVDAHCAFDEGFDLRLIEHIEDNCTIVPTMRNLHAFNWVCKNGHSRYQGPSGPCKDCGEPTEMDVVWIPKTNPQSNSYCFDSEPHFQYFNEYGKRSEGKGSLTESMSLQGSCFMISKENYFKWNVCDESFGSWGSQGIEVAVKTWFNGGRVVVDHSTWYAHMFRTQGGDFGFPYHLSGRQVEEAKKHARNLLEDQSKQRNLNWLLKKFWPVPGWTEQQLLELATTSIEVIDRPSKGIIYYTDNSIDENILLTCQRQLLKSGLPIVSCSLKERTIGMNSVLDLQRGYLTMFKQILDCLERITADVIFFAEHDVLYHPSHFNFIPSKEDVFYYNENVWKVDFTTGKGIHYDCKQVSGLVSYRNLLLEHYRKRVQLVEQNGFTRAMGFEPGTHNREERVDDYESESYMSKYPNIDIRHENNLTESRWSQDQFRNPVKNWIENDNIPGWGHLWHFWKKV